MTRLVIITAATNHFIADCVDENEVMNLSD